MVALDSLTEHISKRYRLFNELQTVWAYCYMCDVEVKQRRATRVMSLR